MFLLKRFLLPFPSDAINALCIPCSSLHCNSIRKTRTKTKLHSIRFLDNYVFLCLLTLTLYQHLNSQPQLKNLKSTCLENICLYNHEFKDLHTKSMFQYRKKKFFIALTWNFSDSSLSHQSYNVVHSASYYKASVCQGVTHSKLHCDEHEKLLNQFLRVLRVNN